MNQLFLNTCKKVSVPVIVALASLSVSAAVQSRTIEETFDVSEGGKLYLRTDAGSVEVETHNNPQVRVLVDIDGKNEDEFEVRFDHDGSDLAVYGEKERGGSGWGWGRNLRVDFTLVVPENYNIDVNTSGGSISVEDLVGDIEADTSGGSISIGKVKGDVDLRTSGGSINTEEVSGQIDAHTSGGSVHVEFTEQIEQDAKLSTSGGSITAYLPEDIQLDISASTSGGRVKTDFDIDGRVKKQSINGEINGGGPKLKLNTSGGNISIRSR